MRLEILTMMLMKTSVFRNVTTCRDLDETQNRDQRKKGWMSGSIIARIPHEPLTAPQKDAVPIRDSW